MYKMFLHHHHQHQKPHQNAKPSKGVSNSEPTPIPTNADPDSGRRSVLPLLLISFREWASKAELGSGISPARTRCPASFSSSRLKWDEENNHATVLPSLEGVCLHSGHGKKGPDFAPPHRWQVAFILPNRQI